MNENSQYHKISNSYNEGSNFQKVLCSEKFVQKVLCLESTGDY